jgi:phage internal scaffolding protein
VSKKPIVRTKFDRIKVSTKVEGPSMAQQNMKDKTDINLIMKKYQKTGLIQHVAQGNADYGDFSDVQSYDAALNQVMEAQEAFMTLSADLRARFGNSPGQMLAFLGDASNLEEAIELGLVEKPVENDRGSEIPPAPPVESGVKPSTPAE